ncbi:hypothetical protein AVEN_247163-1, partial [Araneus ventricosus]
MGDPGFSEFPGGGPLCEVWGCSPEYPQQW